ncbi:TSUP family transporter [Ignatzschineria rhizosphaerae]|uniref:Probable membrane transporter protein n=1 Tax=Ignatzschineria rhizosphaerae TaxID=2923279 RepID=A0ABY3X4Y7_9GAMM|nr:TSUP family transporter [Ignatzschineria rhizosphaerae]UNM97340.1 TSUP family transporter [Ignatzschineria rhizosphaerae]
MNISPIVISTIFLFSALLHGLTGMGFPMIPTSIIANISSFEEAIILALFPALLINIIMLTSQNDRPILQELTYYIHTYWLMVLAVVVGGYLGVKLLLFLEASYLYLLLSSIILFYVITNLIRIRWRITTNPFTLVFFGFITGIIGNATDAMAPLLMIYLLSTDKSTKEIIKAGNLAYLTGKVVQFWMLKSVLFTLPSTDLLILTGITGITLLALFIGIYCRRFISEIFFKRLILIILLILGIRAGINGMMLLLG